MRGGPTLDQLTQQLSLTDDQKAKVKIVLDARDQKLKDLRADTTLSPEDRRAQMQAIRQDVTAQLKAILTPEQFAKYQKMTPIGWQPAASWYSAPRGSAATIICGVTYIDTGTAISRPFLFPHGFRLCKGGHDDL
jgi:hypothetical protein